jgi:uncharacterized protein DUF1553/uncharacterized protein DUF1549/cytochrome c
MTRILAVAICAVAIAPIHAQTKIDFNRDIRPILSENCFVCHGPDEGQRKAKLRLDTRDGAIAKLRTGGHAVVPGKSGDSELLRRILTDDVSERMPPVKTNKKLTARQIDLLKNWIEQGAPYSQHWAFVSAKRPGLPSVKNQTWVRNAIDRFILARLEKDGLTPSPEADKTTLIRRLALDLTGLPPTLSEIDAFLNDKRPGAYERAVERYLASPHHGERLAVDWLDAARFADTHGYHIDAGRDMTRWREWVIDAFNRDLPFDRFTIEQLAGDLLPNATLEQKIASGFNRNHMINFEGGAIPEEYLNNYIVDRVNTTSTVWLGLTMTCAQCHDHKYDPISQKEFYQIYAFFNNLPENGLDGSRGNAAPMISVPNLAARDAIAKLAARIKTLEDEMAKPNAELDQKQAAWEKSAASDKAIHWTPLIPDDMKSAGGAKLTRQKGGSILVTGANPATDTFTFQANVELKTVTAIRLEALPHETLTDGGPGRSQNGNFVLTDFAVEAKGNSLAVLDATSSFEQKDFPVKNAIKSKGKSGWAIFPEVGKANQAVFSITPTPGGVLTIRLTFGSQFGQHTIGNLRLSATSAASPHREAGLPADIAQILAVPSDKRSPEQVRSLRVYYRAVVLDQGRAEIASLRMEKTKLEAMGNSTTMVMQDGKPRDTFMLVRGEYNKKGDKVSAGVPAFLPPLAKDTPANRLGLARWLTDPAHPLMSRVIVNRYWQMFFGTGLVKTVEDFGSQGELPSHPELLDWLAVEFMTPMPAPGGVAPKRPWSLRDLIRTIVTSSTYRQSSVITKEHLARDPENRLLARGPRFRLQAEFIRDQALAVSGLLNREIGGKSVSPYQPAGLWQELAARQDSKNWSAQFFVQSKGKDLYRRTMYTFWKRTSPPPQLVTFDAPDREVCTVRRSRTNTPLQALVLMNDPTYVEASRKFAERMMKQEKTPEARLSYAWRLATSRAPSEREIGILKRTLDKQLANFHQNPKAAESLLRVGESSRDESLSAPELAAYTIMASVILNLDEVVNKN